MKRIFASQVCFGLLCISLFAEDAVQYVTVERSPYLIVQKEISGESREDIRVVPGKFYRLETPGELSAQVIFTDQDAKLINRLELQSGQVFRVPLECMRCQLQVAWPETPSTLRVVEISDRAEAFSWLDWNSWNMAGPIGAGLVRRNFHLEQLPEYAVGRFWGRCDVLLNDCLLGKASQGYVNSYYYDLRPLLKPGLNNLLLKYPDNASGKPQIVAVDIELRYASGESTIILASDGTWEYQDSTNDNWVPLSTFQPCWYKAELFDKPWVAPSAIPDDLLPPCPIELKSDYGEKRHAVSGQTQKFSLQIKFQGMPFFASNRFAIDFINQDGRASWRQWYFPAGDLRKMKAGECLEMELDLVTDYLSPGTYTLRLDRRLDDGHGNGLGELEITEAKENNPLKTSFEVRGCIDSIVVEGQAMPAAIYHNAPYYKSHIPRNVEDNYWLMRQSGHQFFTVTGFFGTDIVKTNTDRGSVWIGPDQYDFSSLDDRMIELLSVVPDAKIIFKLLGDNPGWWIKAHPDECVVWDDGSKHQQPSWASLLWQRDTCKAITELAKYLRKSPWCKQIVAWYLSAGYDGQWFQPTNYKAPYNFSDYSQHMLKYFQNWLIDKYQNDQEKLRIAWNQADVSFETVAIPSREERQGKNYYLDPKANQNVIDFAYCQAALTNQLIAMFAEAFRLGWEADIPFGTYYMPYDVTYFNGQAQRPSDDAILDDSSYNFAAAPLGYQKHGLNQAGTSNPQHYSYILNNKIRIGEDDTRTFRSQPHEGIWGNFDSFGTLAGMRRNIAQRLTSGGGHWYYDMYGHWYNAPSIQALFKKELHLMNVLSSWAKLHCLDPEVVNVTKVGTSLHKRVNTQPDLHQVHFAKINQSKPGFQVAEVHLRHLDHAKLPKFKIYIFDDLFALDSNDRKLIEQKKQNGNVLLFTHASGFSDCRTLDAKNISSLTGINIEEASPGVDLSPMAWNTSQEREIWGDLCGKTIHAPNAKRFFVNDPEATVIGTYKADPQPAAAIKKFPDWTSIYLPCAYPSGEILDQIASLCQVHVYTDASVYVHTGGRLVSVYCPVDECSGSLKLPEMLAGCEVFSGQVFAPTSELKFTMQLGETKLFFLGSELEVKNFQTNLKTAF